MGDDEYFKVQYQQLKSAFIQSLLQRGALIETATQDLRLSSCPADRADAFERLHSELHKLAGACGMYGLAELSEMARELELHCKGDSQSALLALAGGVEALIQLIDEAQSAV